MNLLLLESKDLINENEAIIDDDRAVHIKKVLKLKTSDCLKVGLLNGFCGSATILTMSDTQIHLQLNCQNPPPTPLPLTVVMALPRPKMLRRILKNLAEFGIKECHFINSYKVEKSFWQTPALAQHTMHKYLCEGLMQSKDTLLPNIHLHKYFKPFVEDILPDLCHDKEAFIAHPYQSLPMPEVSREPRLIIIGPEGGFTEYEVNLIGRQGVHAINMGQRIYKVENALTRLAAQLSASD